MSLSDKQIAVILGDDHLLGIIRSNLRDISRTDLLETQLDRLSELDAEILRDEVFQVWREYAPIVKECVAEQDKGPYPVCIRGLEGAYFVTAGEYPDSESHASLMDAETYVEANYGRFLLD